MGYRCGGYASESGHCGAYDCETCHPGGAAAIAAEEAADSAIAAGNCSKCTLNRLLDGKTPRDAIEQSGLCEECLIAEADEKIIGGACHKCTEAQLTAGQEVKPGSAPDDDGMICVDCYSAAADRAHDIASDR